MELFLISSYPDSGVVTGKVNGFLNEVKFMSLISGNTTTDLHYGVWLDEEGNKTWKK